MNKRKIYHFNKSELNNFLEKLHNLPTSSIRYYKGHMDNCEKCWQTWNEVRWDRASNTSGFLELQEYLGDKFVNYFDSSWALANEWLKIKPKSDEEIANFYKKTKHYLYNLLIWYESGDRIDFRNDFKTLREKYGVNSVLDYGCGVGNDGLYLLENGFEVVFVDYNCPSTDFLKWRLKKRKLKATVIDVETIEKSQKLLPDTDVFWAIDVLEHMVHPTWVIDRLSDDVKLFVHRSKFFNTAGGRHPHHLPYDENIFKKALEKKSFSHVPWKNLSVWKRDFSLI